MPLVSIQSGDAVLAFCRGGIVAGRVRGVGHLSLHACFRAGSTFATPKTTSTSFESGYRWWKSSSWLLSHLSLWPCRRSLFEKTCLGRSRQTMCQDNLKQIAHALRAYEEAKGDLPPTYTTDNIGNPTLSWRVLILPYLESGALYNSFNPDEPWNGPINRPVSATIIPTYACPSDASSLVAGRYQTNYLAVVGPNCAGRAHCCGSLPISAQRPQTRYWLLRWPNRASPGRSLATCRSSRSIWPAPVPPLWFLRAATARDRLPSSPMTLVRASLRRWPTAECGVCRPNAFRLTACRGCWKSAAARESSSKNARH